MNYFALVVILAITLVIVLVDDVRLRIKNYKQRKKLHEWGIERRVMRKKLHEWGIERRVMLSHHD